MQAVSHNVACGQIGPQKALKCQCDQILSRPAGHDKTVQHVWSFAKSGLCPLYKIQQSSLCVSLQTLSLDGNLLSSLPDELGGLAQLNSLSLSFNSFSHIPAVLERLSAVDKLAMAGNRVETLDLCTLARMSQLKNIDLR